MFEMWSGPMADKTETNRTASAPATPGKTDAKADAAKPGPAKAPSPVKTVAAKAEPAKPDSGKAEITKSESVQAEPAKTVAAKPEAAKPPVAKAEPINPVSTPAPAAKPAAAKPTSPVAAKPAPVAAKPAPKPIAAQSAAAQAPKIKSAPVAKAEKPKPTEVAAPKRGRPAKAISPAEPAPIVAQKAEPAAATAITEGSKTMNDTIAKAQDTTKKFTNEASARTQALFGEFSERAKTSYEKGVKFAEEMTEFSKGNVEALVESSKVAAKGVETMSQEAADYARKAIENSTAAFKTFASAKSPTEFFKLQSDYAKSYFDNAVAESSKVTEAWLKLAGDVAQPLSNRYAVAVEKIKIASA
jgi:phasin family protein